MVNTANLSYEMKVFYHQYRKILMIQKLKKAIDEGKIILPNDTELWQEWARTEPLSDSVESILYAWRVIAP